MSVSSATQAAILAQSIPDQSSPELTYDYEYVEGGFFYSVAHTAGALRFVSLPGFTATQVQELIDRRMERSTCFPPETLDGSQAFGFTHGWQVHQYQVGIVAEDGKLTYTVYDEAGNEIHEEKIPQTDGNNEPLPAGEIFSRYVRSTPFVNPDGKVCFFCLVHPTKRNKGCTTWERNGKTLSFVDEGRQCILQLFDHATKKTSQIPPANIFLENPQQSFYQERFYNVFPPEDCPVFLLDREYVNVGQLLECASAENKTGLIWRISKVVQTYLSKVCVTSDNQSQSILFRPEAIMSVQSKLDPKITVNESCWAVTLVNRTAPSPKWPFGHAVLLIETVQDGQYKMMEAHFTVIPPKKTECGRKKNAMIGNSPGSVEFREVLPPYHYHYHSKAETWSLPRCEVERMIAEIEEEIAKQKQGETPVYFSGRGHGTIFMREFIRTPDGLRRIENCLSWAVKKLLSHGAVFYHLPEGIVMNRPVEYISSYERSRSEAIEYRKKLIMVTEVIDLCFIKYFAVNSRRMKIPTLHVRGWSDLGDRVDNLFWGRSAYAMGHDIFIKELGRILFEVSQEQFLRIMLRFNPGFFPHTKK